MVPELLRAYGNLARREVQACLAAERPAPYLTPLLADYPARPGKMMRSALTVATAVAFGARPEHAARAAAGVELFHNALLIHDDIEDDSDLRRGAPTLHRLHGVAQALNAGDALLLLAMKPLLAAAEPLGDGVTRQLLSLTMRMAQETAEGQALELGWRDGNVDGLTDADYFNMALKKTAWMSTIWPMQVGLLLGTRGRVDPEIVARFGFFLGVAFQIQDDLLNLVADQAYGKESHGDLYEAKRTLMLIHVQQAATPAERCFIEQFLAAGRAGRTAAMVAKLDALMARHGSIAHARAVAGGLAGAAAREFDLVFGRLPPSRDTAFLAGLVPWIFERT